MVAFPRILGLMYTIRQPKKAVFTELMVAKTVKKNLLYTIKGIHFLKKQKLYTIKNSDCRLARPLSH